MPEYNITFDWNRISTLGKVKVLVEQVVGAPSQEAINTAVADYIEAHPGALSPLSPSVKSALLQIAEKVAYVDENGQDYYNALDAALNAIALLSITAVYTQSGTVYETDSLDSLKADLVVTAYYDDGTTGDVTSAAVLSGTLEEGTSTITATYQEKTATFDVVVSRVASPLYPFENGTKTFTTYPKTLTITEGHIVYAELINNNNKDLKANISTISANTDTGNTDSNNSCSTTKLYTIPSGATVRCEVTPTQLDYPGALNAKSLNIVMRDQSGTNVGAVLATTGYTSLHLNQVVVNEFVAESDLDVWNTTIWLNNNGSVSAKFTFDVKIFVNGVRYV